MDFTLAGPIRDYTLSGPFRDVTLSGTFRDLTLSGPFRDLTYLVLERAVGEVAIVEIPWNHGTGEEIRSAGRRRRGRVRPRTRQRYVLETDS